MELLGKFPQRLSREQVSELSRCIIKRCDSENLQELEKHWTKQAEARRLLVEHNLHLVYKIATKYRGRGVEVEDLFQEGCIGLNRAANDYDESVDTTFSTYATYWIKQCISKYLKNHSRVIRLPHHILNNLSKWNAEIERHKASFDSIPSDQQIASQLGFSKKMAYVVKRARACGTIDTSAEGEIIDQKSIHPNESPPDTSMIHERLKILTDREREILFQRYGLEGHQRMLLRQVGQSLKISRERVRQIQSRAEEKLRNSLPPHR